MEKVLIQIEANITWAVARDEQAGVYIGVCHSLNLNAVGDTYQEFLEGASEAMDLLFTDLVEEGEFEAFLRRNGWRAKNDGHRITAGQSPNFDVPFNVSMGQMGEVYAAARA